MPAMSEAYAFDEETQIYDGNPAPILDEEETRLFSLLNEDRVERSASCLELSPDLCQRATKRAVVLSLLGPLQAESTECVIVNRSGLGLESFLQLQCATSVREIKGLAHGAIGIARCWSVDSRGSYCIWVVVFEEPVAVEMDITPDEEVDEPDPPVLRSFLRWALVLAALTTTAALSVQFVGMTSLMTEYLWP